VRLITRGDMDGLTSAVFLTQKEPVTSIVFADPKDMQDGLVEVERGDIIVNLPYHPNCGLWFDHHESEGQAAQVSKFVGLYGVAPSAARLVYRYYNDRELDRYGEMLAETDRIDSARLAVDDVLHPERWVMLSYTLDPRSGLGAYQLYFNRLVVAAKRLPIEEMLALPEVEERVASYVSEQERFEKVTRQCSYVDHGIIITDFRELATNPVGNRFLVYTIFPQANISVRIFWGRGRSNIVISVAHSIFNRTSKVHAGKLLAEFGGGGLRGAGTTQVPPEETDRVIPEIIGRIREAV